MESAESALQTLSRLSLSRQSELSLHHQLRSAIEMSIMLGELPDGTQLPSVRQLADALDVAPGTVLRCYVDLKDEQLIKSVPKKGYFVTSGPVFDTDPLDTSSVRTLIDQAIDLAYSLGLDRQSLLRIVSESMKTKRPADRHLAVVGMREAAHVERTRIFQEAVADLGVKVDGIAIEDLESQSKGYSQIALNTYEYFLVPVGETQRVAAVLGPRMSRIVPWTRAVRGDVRDFIASQPRLTRFGLIGTKSLMGRTVSMLRRIHPLAWEPYVVGVDDSEDSIEYDRIKQALEESDVILIGSLTLSRILHLIPDGKPWRELVYVPSESTLQRLRSLLQEARS